MRCNELSHTTQFYKISRKTMTVPEIIHILLTILFASVVMGIGVIVTTALIMIL
jgi:hypothetical protein